ncbi:MAG: tetratricopeptide repeat protein [Pseudomonadota bacterium]
MKPEKLEALANEGNLDANFELAKKYAYGSLGYERNPELTVKLYKKGAQAGHPDSMLYYGTLYKTGNLNTKKNYRTAVKWMEKSAQAGNTDAMMALSELYLDKKAGVKDETKAFQWTKKAADSNHILALNPLANMYHKGIGTTKDYYQAAKWYYVWQSMFSEHTEPMQRITDALWDIHQQIGTPAMEQAKAEAEDYYANNEMNFGN